MNTKPRLEYIQLAKELTRSEDIQVILAAARELEEYLGDKDIDDAGYSLPDSPIKFMEECKIWTVAHGLVPLRLHSYQKGWVDWLHDDIGDVAPTTAQPEILITARQMGTSTIMPLYATYLAARSAWTRVMVVAPRFYSASETRERVQAAIEGMGLPVEKIAKTKITLQNGSEITFGVPTDLGRGASPAAYNVVVMLDAGFYPYAHDHEMTSYVMRAVSGGTRVIITSSARYAKGFMFDLIDKHQVPWMKTTYDAHPERDGKWLQHMRDSIGPVQWKSEMECEFITVEDEPKRP